MSSSDTPSQNVRLHVDAGNPTIEIFVIDGYFRRVAKGRGVIDITLPPGIYEVKSLAGSVEQAVHVALKSGSTPVSVTIPATPFSAPAPLAATLTSHEYHEEAAHWLSTQVHRTIGAGQSQLFVFVRDLDRQGSNDPATGLSLHDMDGNLLIDFTKVGEREIHDPTQDHWTGCNVRLDAGSYRLRIRTDTVGTLEQVVVTSPGWQTQVFLLRKLYGYKRRLRRADLNNASVLMAPIGQGFQPGQVRLKQTELARQGLENQRAVIDAEEMKKLLHDKYQSPMLGIYGAHLLLLDPEPDRELIGEVTRNLLDLIGPHPDVLALDIWHKEATKQDAIHPDHTYNLPPMLSSSWRIFVTTSTKYPDIVPSGSFAAQIADRIWGYGAWLVWQKPNKGRQSSGTTTSTSFVDASILQNVLPQITEKLAGTTSSEPTTEIAQSSGLNDLERSLLEYISKTISSRGQSMFSLTSAALVQTLGLPYAVISDAVEGLLKKMKLTP
jgi:hypothetical protein